MLTKSFESFNDAYYDLYAMVDDCGVEVTPRGYTCVELRPAAFELTRPDLGIYTGKSRKLSYRFYAIETLGYLAGLGGPDNRWYADLLVDSNKGMAYFVNEETGVFDGAYGPRLSQSYQKILDLLTADPSSRQAVASVWSPGIPESKDVPCTVMLHFMQQPDECLDLYVYMRSNDLNWGTPYDVAAFCSIQRTIANYLGWSLGSYYHFTGSLHFYDQDADAKTGPRRPSLLQPSEEEWTTGECLSLYRPDLDFQFMTMSAWIMLQDVQMQRAQGVHWKDLDLAKYEEELGEWLIPIRENRLPETNERYGKGDVYD